MDSISNILHGNRMILWLQKEFFSYGKTRSNFSFKQSTSFKQSERFKRADCIFMALITKVSRIYTKALKWRKWDCKALNYNHNLGQMERRRNFLWKKNLWRKVGMAINSFRLRYLRMTSFRKTSKGPRFAVFLRIWPLTFYVY